MNYPTHWKLAYTLAFFFHLAVYLFVQLVIPHIHLTPEEPPPVDEIAWEMVGVPEGEIAEEIPIPPEPPKEEPPKEEPPPPVEDEVIVEEIAPVVAEDEAEAIAKLEKEEETNKETPKAVQYGDKGVQMAEPAVLLKRVDPPDGLQFRGRVTINVRINPETGRAMEVRVMRSSGRRVFDEVCKKAAMSWVFKPARDQNDKPISSWYLAGFDFPAKKK